MTISGALANATSGLAATSRRAELVSGNIANALTPGYARRELAVSEQTVGGRGAGVNVNGVVRATDPVLSAEKRLASGALSKESVAAEAYKFFSDALGSPEDAFGLFASVAQLEAGLRSLAQTPESVAGQATVLDAAQTLARNLNDLSMLAQNSRLQADTRIAAEISSVNDSLKQIEKLNGSIAGARNGGRDSSALEDQRKRLIDEISSVIPLRELPRADGRIELMTPEGVFLLAGEARELTFAPATVMAADIAYDAGSGILSGLSIDGVNITPGSGGQAVRQGSLAGLFAVRDTVAPEFQSQLDALSADLLQRFEGRDTTVPPGTAGLFTDAGAAYDATRRFGLAGRIAVNKTVDPASGGDLWRLRDGFGAAVEGQGAEAGFIIALLDAATEQRGAAADAGFSGAFSAAEGAAALTTSVGAARLASEARTTSASARAEAVADAEAAITGVDTDAELQRLILIEQAYAANARVIQTAEQMVRQLMELLR